MAHFATDLAMPWVKKIFHLALPPRCLSCDVLVGEHGGLCASCFKDLSLVDKPICDVTGKPLAYDLGEEIISAEAIATPPLYRKMRFATRYEGTARHLILSMKFHDRLDLVPALARYMTRAGRDLIKEADLLISVPLHRQRLFSRRFNQAAELAKEIGKITNKPLLLDGLKRIRPTKQQTQLNTQERLQNVEGAFRLRPEYKPQIAGKHILLIDDVVTTGATSDACIRTLLREKAAYIDVLCFSKVVDEDTITI